MCKCSLFDVSGNALERGYGSGRSGHLREEAPESGHGADCLPVPSQFFTRLLGASAQHSGIHGPRRDFLTMYLAATCMLSHRGLIVES
jgi:hypothetical protein